MYVSTQIFSRKINGYENFEYKNYAQKKAYEKRFGYEKKWVRKKIGYEIKMDTSKNLGTKIISNENNLVRKM